MNVVKSKITLEFSVRELEMVRMAMVKSNYDDFLFKESINEENSEYTKKLYEMDLNDFRTIQDTISEILNR